MVGLRLQAHSHVQTQVLTAQQLALVHAHKFSLRLALIAELHGERYEPKGECPSCGRVMTPAEIIRGFNQDPNDYTTACTACGCRFEPKLVCFDKYSRMEIPFYCDIQTLEKLRGRDNLSPQELAGEFPGVYRSAIVHHGGIRNAFKKIGIDYPFEEISDWQSKAAPFLGRLPDTVIADSAGVKVSAVRAMRRKLGIERYTADKALAEIE